MPPEVFSSALSRLTTIFSPKGTSFMFCFSVKFQHRRQLTDFQAQTIIFVSFKKDTRDEQKEINLIDGY
jgi:hypothetical protein